MIRSLTSPRTICTGMVGHSLHTRHSIQIPPFACSEAIQLPQERWLSRLGTHGYCVGDGYGSSDEWSPAEYDFPDSNGF